MKALIHFRGAAVNRIKRIYSDRGPSLDNAAEVCSIPHDHSTPGCPQSNGIVERQVQMVLNGARAALAAAGLPTELWPWAAEHYCMSENMRQDEGNSPYQGRHGKVFPGLHIPFGSYVNYIPSKTTKIGQELTKLDEKAVPGIFIGYELQTNCRWDKHYKVIPLRVLANLNFKSTTTGQKAKVMRFLHTIEDVKLVPDTKPWFPIREPYVYANKTLGGMVDALDKEQYEMLYGESAYDAGEQSDDDFLHPSPHEADGEPQQHPPHDLPEHTDSSPQPGTSGLDHSSNDRCPRHDAYP
jgi:hypothetical protein